MNYNIYYSIKVKQSIKTCVLCAQSIDKIIPYYESVSKGHCNNDHEITQILLNG